MLSLKPLNFSNKNAKFFVPILKKPLERKYSPIIVFLITFITRGYKNGFFKGVLIESYGMIFDIIATNEVRYRVCIRLARRFP